ncbi:hypothetical protein [Absiella sp. AM29-15]|uniref:hypothetical protein n=1 Tax=Absiella sp. AM29-15 TaxID=2292278 RepID=UPI000E414FF8|nr:hypothetical protein [Absiella sp. AM29-15]RGC44913.1 hypothetical protein DW761_19190 [Absiella sp. AM29-15]
MKECSKSVEDYNTIEIMNTYVEILGLGAFFKHIVFPSDGEKCRIMVIKDYTNVSVVVDIEYGDTTE